MVTAALAAREIGWVQDTFSFRPSYSCLTEPRFDVTFRSWKPTASKVMVVASSLRAVSVVVATPVSALRAKSKPRTSRIWRAAHDTALAPVGVGGAMSNGPSQV